MNFSPVKRTKVSEEVASTIREAIVAGRYDVGDQLPTERELAEQFGCNRSSIREAMHRLEAWGLIEVRHGAGARVTDFLSTAGLHLLPFLIAPGGRVDGPLVRDLLELRVEILGWTAGRAAANAEDAGKARLAEVLADLEDAVGQGDIDAIQELDYDFFEQLVAISNNRVLALLSNMVRKVYLEQRALFATIYRMGLDLSFHHRTLAAVRNNDVATARQAMSDYGRVFLGPVGRTP